MTTIPDPFAAAWQALQAGELDEAERLYGRILVADPTAVPAWYLLGSVHLLRGRLDPAEAHFRQALRLAPGHAESWSNLGLVLQGRGAPTEAVDAYRRALLHRPGYADALSNLGNALQDLGRFDEAVESYRRALALQPDHADAHHNLGNALRARGELTEAAASYSAALQFRPDDPQLHFSRALAWLQDGDFERGWPEFAWQWRCPELARPSFAQPVWDGESLDGRSILLLADQGFGDTLQFVRYIPWVRSRGGRVIVACQRPLVRLLRRCPGIDRVIVEGKPFPAFDVHASLLDLPRIAGTTLATVPAEVPYLRADPDLVARWRRELGSVPGLKVGVAWQGNPRHRQDRRRSFRLAQLEPLARCPGVRLISLQKGFGAEQVAELPGTPRVIELGSRLEDFLDTAAVIANLDLVIAPDTAIAHLAGALGVPVWVALPFAPDWRWLAGRDDSPWYPTLRLFRQTAWGRWDDVFERIENAIKSPYL